jgi:hypothetical protein
VVPPQSLRRVLLAFTQRGHVKRPARSDGLRAALRRHRRRRNTKVIEHGSTGYLVPAENPDTMAQRILELLGNPERAQSIGTAARRAVEKSFSVQQMINRIVQSYDHLILTRGAGRVPGSAIDA